MRIYLQESAMSNFNPDKITTVEDLTAEQIARSGELMQEVVSGIDPITSAFNAAPKEALRATEKYVSGRVQALQGSRVSQEDAGNAMNHTPVAITKRAKKAVKSILGGAPYRPVKEVDAGEYDTQNFVAKGPLDGISPLKAAGISPKENKGLAKNYEDLISKFPEEWQKQMRNMLTAKVRNGGGNIDSAEIMSAPAIFLSNTARQRGCVYVEGEIIEFPIISNGNSIKGVTKYNKLRCNVNPRGDASVSGSSTVMGCALTGEGLSAKWIHGVDPIRMGGGKTRGCIGLKNEDMVHIGGKIANNATLSGSTFRSGKWNKKKTLHTKPGMLNVYNLNNPVINYTV